MTYVKIIVILYTGKNTLFYKMEVKFMKKVNIMLGTINDVKDFVNAVAKYDFDVDLVSGRYAIDAKSIMGYLSLEFSKKITIYAYN